MTVRAPMTRDPGEWVKVEPDSTAPNGALDATRWRKLNQLISMSPAMDRDETVEWFCRLHRIPRWRVEAELAAFRHFSPDSWQ